MLTGRHVIQALANKEIKVGELVVPLFFKKHNSMVMEEEGLTLHPKAVTAMVSWTVAVSEAENRWHRRH